MVKVILLDSDVVVEVNKYSHAVGKWIVEVDFTDQAVNATDFVPPAWFGEESTDQQGYDDISLSIHGWPSSQGLGADSLTAG